ncbi:hypothetical protein OG943_30345 [Amycolatopsis sp. NBC_00345]|uniref:hypothetical protein n=1 Tax=Amycolatopsis sp. NBC_00345 TaxID=2975955 RepID=UPI002E261687
MEALAVVADLFGAILAAGVGWLIEHVGPLKEALDKLAGDPNQITAHAGCSMAVTAHDGLVGGTSPSAREAHLPRARGHRIQRIIPAGAGSTWVLPPVEWVELDHPCGRGEHTS